MLGKSHAQFQVLTRRPGAVCEWRRYGKTAPWVMKVSDGDRMRFYIATEPGHFEVTVVLGERAVAAALAGRVAKKLHASIREAKPRGVPSLTRNCACDVPRAQLCAELRRGVTEPNDACSTWRRATSAVYGC